jgi:DNA-binding transcriptional MerR regulator
MENFSGIKAHTIRIWEKRYSLFDPIRTDTNIRLYTDNDVRKILNVAMLVKSGYKISNIALLSDEKVQSEVLRINKYSNDAEKSIDQLLFQAINLDTQGFERLLEDIIQEKGIKKAMEQIVHPFFQKIGVLWQVGSLFVAHEHFVSNLIRSRLIVEAFKFKDQEKGKSVLFFLREGEWHELGLLYYNYIAAESGLRCVYLGQSLPSVDLENILSVSKFDFLCTSFVNAIEKQELEEYLAGLSKMIGSGKLLIFGRQLSVCKPILPSNAIVIRTSDDYIKAVSQKKSN